MSALLRDYSLSAEEVPIIEECVIDVEESAILKERIRQNLQALGATLVAHYYVDGSIQDLAQETGGFVSDSLEMARFGRDCESDTLIVSGVRFMGETAKILTPEKRVLMPESSGATCSSPLAAVLRRAHRTTWFRRWDLPACSSSTWLTVVQPAAQL